MAQYKPSLKGSGPYAKKAYEIDQEPFPRCGACQALSMNVEAFEEIVEVRDVHSHGLFAPGRMCQRGVQP